MELRQKALGIFQKTVSAINVESVIHRNLRSEGSTLDVCGSIYDLNSFTSLIVIAVGKASMPMANAAARILGRHVTAGMIATSAVTGGVPDRFRLFVGGHPIPNAESLKAADAALEMLRASNTKETLVLFLISGGGSAIFEKPVNEAVSLDDVKAINRVLVGCGAIISEMNLVRRFLSAVKGGRLAEAADRATQVSLYVSDVNSDDLSSVSSGLTLAGTATRKDFDQIVARHNLLELFPPRVAALIASGTLPDPPKLVASPGRSHHLLLDNRRALEVAAAIAARDYGLVAEVAGDLIEGEVEEMAKAHLKRLRILREKHPGRGVCLLSGGEVICPVHGDGQGGRNQEFVLRAALHTTPGEKFVALSAGTDGIDGQSPAAGAIADQETIERARSLGLSAVDYLERSDSYRFFEALGDAIVTGPTGNNVRDLRILISEG